MTTEALSMLLDAQDELHKADQLVDLVGMAAEGYGSLAPITLGCIAARDSIEAVAAKLDAIKASLNTENPAQEEERA